MEVQLRTREQDSWAKIVDDLTSTTRIDFKNGDGPDNVHELLRRLSEVQAMRESGQPHTQILVDILTPLAMIAAFGHIIHGKEPKW
jgi:ppGpp synthetase/RelA/SpoT-type nucleotidyltranferase